MDRHGTYTVFLVSQSGDRRILTLHQDMSLYELRAVLLHLCDPGMSATDVAGVYEESTHICFPLSTLLASPAAVHNKTFRILVKGGSYPFLTDSVPDRSVDFSPLMKYEPVPQYSDIFPMERESEFADDEIEYLVDLLRLAQPDGDLFTADTFCRCFNVLIKHTSPGEQGGVPTDAGMRLFRRLDTRQRGLLSIHDIVSGLSNQQVLSGLRQQADEQRDQWLRDIFDACDVSRTGMVSFEEMRRYLLSVFLVMRQQDPTVFQHFGVSPDELAAATTRQCFMEVDRDRDGLLSFADFKAWYGAPSNQQFQRSVAKYSTPAPSTEPSAPVMPRFVEPSMLTELANLVPFVLNRPDRLRQLFRIHAPNGLISREGFHRLFQEIAEPSADPYRVRALAQDLFQFLDIDGNGVVDTKELISGLTLLANNNKDSAVRATFAAYDANGDGFVGKEEMRTYLTGMFRMMLGMDQTGHLRQLTRGASPEAIAKATTERCFAEADINHDGKLSFEEFRRWYQWMHSKPPSTVASDDFETCPTHQFKPMMYYYSY